MAFTKLLTCVNVCLCDSIGLLSVGPRRYYTEQCWHGLALSLPVTPLLPQSVHVLGSYSLANGFKHAVCAELEYATCKQGIIQISMVISMSTCNLVY